MILKYSLTSFIPQNLLLIILYFASAKIVSSLHIEDSGIVFAVWPPTGIALSALFLYGYRMWIGIFIGAFLFNFTLSPMFPSIQIALTNTLGPLFAFWFLARYNSINIFSNTKSMFNFFISIFIASIITSFGGVFALYLHNIINYENLLDTTAGWFLGDMIGFLLLTPLIESFRMQYQLEKSFFSKNTLVILSILILSAFLVIYTSNEIFKLIDINVL